MERVHKSQVTESCADKGNSNLKIAHLPVKCGNCKNILDDTKRFLDVISARGWLYNIDWNAWINTIKFRDRYWINNNNRITKMFQTILGNQRMNRLKSKDQNYKDDDTYSNNSLYNEQCFVSEFQTSTANLYWILEFLNNCVVTISLKSKIIRVCKIRGVVFDDVRLITMWLVDRLQGLNWPHHF